MREAFFRLNNPVETDLLNIAYGGPSFSIEEVGRLSSQRSFELLRLYRNSEEVVPFDTHVLDQNEIKQQALAIYQTTLNSPDYSSYFWAVTNWGLVQTLIKGALCDQSSPENSGEVVDFVQRLILDMPGNGNVSGQMQLRGILAEATFVYTLLYGENSDGRLRLFHTTPYIDAKKGIDYFVSYGDEDDSAAIAINTKSAGTGNRVRALSGNRIVKMFIPMLRQHRLDNLQRSFYDFPPPVKILQRVLGKLTSLFRK